MNITRAQVAHAEHVVATHTAAVTAERALSGRCLVLCDCDLCERSYTLLDEALALGSYVPIPLVDAVVRHQKPDDGKEGA